MRGLNTLVVSAPAMYSTVYSSSTVPMPARLVSNVDIVIIIGLAMVLLTQVNMCEVTTPHYRSTQKQPVYETILNNPITHTSA